MLPINNGMIGLLTGHDPFYLHFDLIIKSIAAEKGLYASASKDKVDQARDLWREQIAIWSSELVNDWKRQTDRGTKVLGDSTLSHIKKAGALLWALNHEELIGMVEVSALDETRIEELRKVGIDTKIRDLDTITPRILMAHPDEAFSFLFTCAVFNQEQYRHGGALNYNPSTPPMNVHYLANMCWYLFSQQPDIESLYMIFKTMDLFGVNRRASQGVQ